MMRRRARGAALLVMTLVISVLAIVVAYFSNTLGYQSAADIALRSAMRSGGIAAAGIALPDGDPSYSGDDGFARWFIDPGVGEIAVEGVPLSTWAEGTGGEARRIALLVLSGEAGRSGTFADRFAPDLAVILGQSTNDLSRDGMDVEVINPAVDAATPGCASQNGGNCVSATSCTAASVFPAGIISELDGNCYTAPTVVLRIRIAVVQTSGTVTLTRTLAAGAGVNIEAP
jgi:hypothetical protein